MINRSEDRSPSGFNCTGSMYSLRAANTDAILVVVREDGMGMCMGVGMGHDGLRSYTQRS